jgi:hypothetical protein
MIENITIGSGDREKNYVFNTHGLNEAEQELVKDIFIDVLGFVDWRCSLSLKRCNYFVHNGHEPLNRAVEERTDAENPRVEGCNGDTEDQHYWLAFDLTGTGIPYDPKTVLIDPVFNYMGLGRHADEVLSIEQISYYQRRTVINPGKHNEEGGIWFNPPGF